MERFLRECNQNLQKNNPEQTIIIVLGNEACDLDSAVSALVLAFIFHHTYHFEGLVIPVLNVKRKQLRIHTEVTYFLEETCINLDDLICKDEINIKQLSEEQRLKVVLVDHNVLSAEDSFLQPHIAYVVDHHVLEQPQLLENCPTVIEPVGSCCTLVAEIGLDKEPAVIDPQLAMLLYGTILLDTVCLDEQAKRVTEKDKAIVAKLETMLEGISREEVFKALQTAKFSVTGLSHEELLEKDLKIVNSNSLSIAIPSIPVLLEEITNGTSIEPALLQFCCDNHYLAVILMGSHVSKDGKSVRRQIAVFSSDVVFCKKICDFLVSLENPSLELESLNAVSSTLCLFEQRNISLTRKFVLPAIRTFLDRTSELHEKEENCRLGNSCITELTNALHSLNISEEIGIYHPEPVDFPDSPDHGSLFEITSQTKEEESCDTKSATFKPPREFSRNLEDCKSHNSLSSLKKIITVNPSELHSSNVNDDQKSLSSLSNKSDNDDVALPIDLELPDVDDEDIETPDELEISNDSMCVRCSTSEPIAEISAAEEYEEERSWKTCIVNSQQKKIDMRVIEPYKKVLSHGGYCGELRNAIILFSACYLPNRNRKDYDYVMDNLFLYVLTTLDQLVAENYILVYLHGATERGSMPSFGWLKRCYRMIDRRLRKNLKGLYLVHPTFWLKTIVIMTRPFISSKFSRKLRFVNSLEELSSLIPMNHVCIPDKVKQIEFEHQIKALKKMRK